MQGKNIFLVFISTNRDLFKRVLNLLVVVSFFLVDIANAQTPVITPKNQVALKLDGTGNRTVVYTDIADVSGLTENGTVTVNPASLDCSLLGPQTITVTASNGTAANTSTKQIPVIVTSTPVFSDYFDVNIEADSDCKATMPNYITNPKVTDICSNAHLIYKQLPAAGTPLTVNEPIAVTLTAGDQYGGTSAVFFTVTSYSKPVIFPRPAPIILKLDDNGRHTVQVSDLGVVYACDGSVPTITISPKNLTCANLGAQNITLTASTIRPNPQAVTFSVPTDVITDATGNIYVADGYGCTIRKVTPNGTVTTFAGGTCGYADGKGTAASFDVINGITIDHQGNFYVIDEGDRVRKITPDGTVTAIAGNGQNKTIDGTGTAAGFRDPRGITIDASGNLYITQGSDYLIRKVTPAGVVTTITPPSSVSKLNTPIGITADAFGNLYVTDYTSAIKKIASDGSIIIVAGHNGTGSEDGTGTVAGFNLPKGITVDNLGNLYVTDSQNNMIRKITASGVVTTLQLYVTDTNDKASLNNPIGIKMDPFGNLIVVDAANERIVRITPAGQLTTIAGTGIVGHQNGNANAPPTIGSETHMTFPVTVTSSTGSSDQQGGITPTIGSYPINATVCAGDPIQFVATVPLGSYVNSYQWRVNDINNGTNNPFFTSSTLNDGDVVTCMVSNNISCTVPQLSSPIHVHIVPVPEIVFNGNPIIRQGSSIVLNPQIHGNIKALRWTPATGLSSTTIANPTAYPATTTTYSLTVFSTTNCETTVPVTVTVISPIHIPNTFTPNADGVNDRWEISDLQNLPTCTVNVFNRYGQTLFHSLGYNKPWDGTFNGNRLPPGIYYYIIDPKNGIKPLSGWVAIVR